MITVTPNIEEKTIAEIVREDFRTSDVFRSYKIDFCCNGGRQMKDVCNDKGINIDTLISDLTDASQNLSKNDTNYDSWPLSFLCDYIENMHHTYVNNHLPIISEYSTKVARVHGDHHPEVIQVNHLVQELLADLSTHMKKEERILFPMIRAMETGEETTQGSSNVQGPIQVMELDHEAAGSIINRLRTITNDFTPPEDACNTFRVLYLKLEDFETDLFTHIHLENNILFPKAMGTV